MTDSIEVTLIMEHSETKEKIDVPATVMKSGIVSYFSDQKNEWCVINTMTGGMIVRESYNKIKTLMKG